VRIYVEGGGDQQATLTSCRQGFAEFFKKIVPAGRQPRIIACGGRRSAFDDFRTALTQYRDSFCILLVDSEAPVAPGVMPWTHLKTRDGWDRPDGATDDQACLMVQCMEAWFLADKAALATFYGQGFRANALPGQPDVEQVPKSDIFNALASATTATKTKGEYHRTRHGFMLLAHIDPGTLCRASQHAERLAKVLREQVSS
jgi:hypothetical protein